MNSVAEQLAAYKEIKANGIAMTLYRAATGTYNVSTGSNSRAADTQYPTYGIITEYTLWERKDTEVKAGDKKILLAATTGMPEPIQDDDIDVGGVRWAVVLCTPIAPQGVPILYKVQVRR